jgi:type VI secretion system protein VasJ
MSVIDASEIGVSPISSDNPVGNDIRYEPEFEWLQDEIAKLQKPILVSSTGKTNGEQRFRYEKVDWDRVIKVCCDLLSKKSKDLRVMLWLTRALMETEGMDGLVTGLEMVRKSASKYWDSLHPSKPKVRRASFVLLRDLIQGCVQGKGGITKLTFDKEHKKMAQHLLDNVSGLNALIIEKMDDNPVTMDHVTTLIKEQIGLAKKNNPIYESTPEKVNSDSGMSISNNSYNQIEQKTDISEVLAVEGQEIQNKIYDFSNISAKNSYFEDIQSNAILLHEQGRIAYPTDPIPYKWVRMVFWAPLNYPETMAFVPLSGPNHSLIDHFEGLFSERRWEQLFEAVEQQFVSFWFWLDLQRYAIESLEHMGKEYRSVQQAITDELIFLLRRLPHIVTLESQDRIPIASADTQDWLNTTLLVEEDSVEGGSWSGAQSIENESISIIEFEYSGDIDVNLEKAREYLYSARSVREEFYVHLALGKYLVKKREFDLVTHFLKRLEQLMCDHKLESWDPVLAIDALQLRYNCALEQVKGGKGKDNEILKSQMSLLLTRIAVIDPAVAGKLSL